MTDTLDDDAMDEIVPAHYQFPWRGRNTDENEYVDALDVTETFFMDRPHFAIAFKHMVRAGRKPGVPFKTDVDKAIEYLRRSLMHRERRRGGEAKPDKAVGSTDPRRNLGVSKPPRPPVKPPPAPEPGTTGVAKPSVPYDSGTTGDAPPGPKKAGFFDRREKK